MPPLLLNTQVFILNMLKLGKLTDYALLIMGHMAKQPSHVLSAAYLAQALHLSTPTVSKILKILSDAKLVTSLRGAGGGYRLAKEAHTITLTDIIIAMEGGVAMTACCEKTRHCMIDSMCAMKENWRKINGVIQSILGKLTILDMLTPITQTGSLEGLFNDK